MFTTFFLLFLRIEKPIMAAKEEKPVLSFQDYLDITPLEDVNKPRLENILKRIYKVEDLKTSLEWSKIITEILK